MSKAEEKLKNIVTLQQEQDLCFTPVFIRLSNQQALQQLENLLSRPGLQVTDRIEDQLRELIKFKHPQKKFSQEQLNIKIQGHLGTTSLFEYGVWVFYPWANRLVHLLDEEEFIEVRTSRNQYKITPEEKAILSTKKIGVIGLSVGQSVSVTLAMERICGELRLADFDALELTNLNRIRTGVHNLGVLKVYSVAREIAEIDPFICVRCFPQGLTEQNMNEFFTQGGTLDLLVEESDGFDIKILSRYKARELKIPVIMEASDRCMVDVERFDLEPERSILHGLVDHLEIENLKNLKTNEEKIPYMLDVLGIETSSLRLKASMMEIEQSITTWPQLASAVTMGGGITADVSRRMLLNTYTQSGRYHIDIEELIGNTNKKEAPQKAVHPTTEFDFKLAYDSIEPDVNTLVIQTVLSKLEIETIVLAACKAPSGGNAQPWRWIFKQGNLYLFNANPLNIGLLDYAGAASQIALGAAVENVVLQSIQLGYDAEVEWLEPTEPKHAHCRITFIKRSTNGLLHNERAKAIHYRLTNRMLGCRVELEPESLMAIKKAVAEMDGCSLRIFTEHEQLRTIGEVLGDIEQIRLLDTQGHIEFVNEMRWTKQEAEESCDGVDIRTIDLSNSERVGFTLAKQSEIIKLLKSWNAGGAFKKLTTKAIDAAGAVGIITLKRTQKHPYFVGGRALQKAWLEANSRGISLQPVSASVFLYKRVLEGAGKGLDADTYKKLLVMRPNYLNNLHIEEDSNEIFIFRLSKSKAPNVLALRKPLNGLFYQA